mgnify:CR=1 FL=1
MDTVPSNVCYIGIFIDISKHINLSYDLWHGEMKIYESKLNILYVEIFLNYINEAKTQQSTIFFILPGGEVCWHMSLQLSRISPWVVFLHPSISLYGTLHASSNVTAFILYCIYIHVHFIQRNVYYCIRFISYDRQFRYQLVK